jgi:hypothetical protein
MSRKFSGVVPWCHLMAGGGNAGAPAGCETWTLADFGRIHGILEWRKYA